MINCKTGAGRGVTGHHFRPSTISKCKSLSVSQLALYFSSNSALDLLSLIHVVVCVMNITDCAACVYIERSRAFFFLPSFLLANTFAENSSLDNLRTFVCISVVVIHEKGKPRWLEIFCLGFSPNIYLIYNNYLLMMTQTYICRFRHSGLSPHSRADLSPCCWNTNLLQRLINFNMLLSSKWFPWL